MSDPGAAAAYLRLTRLLPLPVIVDLPDDDVRQLVARLHARGWTGDDLAHAVATGLGTAQRPAEQVLTRLRDLDAAAIPPPRRGEETPSPPRYTRQPGNGTAAAADWAARIRTDLATRRRTQHGQDRQAETEPQARPAAVAVPAWYPDPAVGVLRWFDGWRWTDHTHPAPPPPDPVPDTGDDGPSSPTGTAGGPDACEGPAGGPR